VAATSLPTPGKERRTVTSWSWGSNAYWKPHRFELPGTEGGRAWRRWIDTSLPSPQDVVARVKAPAVAGASHLAPPRSQAFLVELLDGESA
jgi:isoamylase